MSSDAAAAVRAAEAVDHALSGSLSSMGVFALLYPLDVARTRQQARRTDGSPGDGGNAGVPNGVVASLLSIFEREGVQGLRRASANISIGVSQALYFFSYRPLRML